MQSSEAQRSNNHILDTLYENPSPLRRGRKSGRKEKRLISSKITGTIGTTLEELKARLGT